VTSKPTSELRVTDTRCEPSDGLHVFERTQGRCDCGARSLPHSTASWVIPEGETWRIAPLPTTMNPAWT